MEPTFVFGIGAQKSATTWLHDWLIEQEDCFGPAFVPGDAATIEKEIHYFDAMTIEEPAETWMGVVERQMAKVMAGIKSGSAPAGDLIARGESLLRKHALYNTPMGRGEAYAAYMKRGWEGQKFILDVTPSYALLDRETFSIMAGIAPKTKFIFIMRDPVKRFWSYARYSVRHLNKSAEEKHAMALARFGNTLGGKTLQGPHRANYRLTIETLESVVPAEDIHYCFYETLFNDGAAQGVADFVGVSATPPDFGRRSNEGVGVSLRPDAETMAKVRGQLQSQYDFVAEKFGDRVPEAWKATVGESAA